MKHAQTITDLNAAYVRETLEYIREAKHLRMTAEMMLSYLSMITRIYEREKERINGYE